MTNQPSFGIIPAFLSLLLTGDGSRIIDLVYPDGVYFFGVNKTMTVDEVEEQQYERPLLRTMLQCDKEWDTKKMAVSLAMRSTFQSRYPSGIGTLPFHEEYTKAQCEELQTIFEIISDQLTEAGSALFLEYREWLLKNVINPNDS